MLFVAVGRSGGHSSCRRVPSRAPQIVCKSPAVPGGGHLDVFATPGDPYDKDGVIGRLAHGEVIVALDAINFAGQRWVLHARGWSVHVAMGWEWLRRIDDDDDADRQRRSARRCR